MTYSSKHSSNTQISRSRIVSHFVNEGFFVYECIYVCNASTSFLNTTFKLKGFVHHKWCHSKPKWLYFFCGSQKEIFFLCVFIHAVKESKTPRPYIGLHWFLLSGKNAFLKTSFVFPGRKKVIQVWNDMRTDDTFYNLFSWYSFFLIKFTFILKTDMWESEHI